MNEKFIFVFAAFLLACPLCGLSVYAEEVAPVEEVVETPTVVEPSPEPVYLTAEDVAALLADSAPEPTEVPEPAEFPGVTQEQFETALSNIVVHIAADQLEQLASPETAQEETPELTIWDKPFEEYNPQEGYALLTFVVVLAAVALFMFTRY